MPIKNPPPIDVAVGIKLSVFMLMTPNLTVQLLCYMDKEVVNMEVKEMF